MNDKTLIRRDYYLNKLIAFKNTSYVKIVTGIRRCGKSKLLDLMMEYLINNGASSDHLIKMNFEAYEFKSLTADEIYEYIKKKMTDDKRYYIFLDEIHMINGWEGTVNALRALENTDIYLTGSNSYLLSSEYATLLSGRCVEIKMLPLSFKEFLDFHGFITERIEDAFGNSKRVFYDQNNVSYDKDELFSNYLRFGGFPGLREAKLNQENALMLLDQIYNTVVVKDIINRPKNKNIRSLTDPDLLERIMKYLADNIGSNISITNISNALANNGLLEYRKNGKKPSKHTIQAYVSALKEAFILYEAKRFDIRGKEYLKTLGKYYIVDLGLRNYMLGFRNNDLGHALENVIYFELLKRGYDVAVGKIRDLEIDFVATKNDEKIYFQVTQSLNDPKVLERELKPLELIDDNYQKIILTLNPIYNSNVNGIEIIDAIDWLLNN